MTALSEQTYLTTEEAATYVRSTKGTLDYYRSTRRPPTYHKRGRTVLYKRSDLDAWLEKVEPKRGMGS